MYEKIIEYILYDRDRNPNKKSGHIFGWTTIFSYCRWNNLENIFYYKKYLEKDFKTTDNFIKMLRVWFLGNFERKYLDFYSFDDNYLYNFLYGISHNKYNKKIYYFRFSEKIDSIGFNYLIKSYNQNPNFLFTNIALGSYFQHNKNFILSYKYYINSLKIDKSNPYVLSKLAILYSSLGGNENLLMSEKIMKKVVDLLPKVPWVNAWYGETLNMIGKYNKALIYINKYEELTKGKHRTFEPFMRKAESYIGLGDFRSARLELNKEKQYYFGEGYRFVYNYLDKKLNKLGF